MTRIFGFPFRIFLPHSICAASSRHGRYWTPAGLAAQTHNPENEKLAQAYLIGVFDVM
jgi:hypothetical protein